MKQTYFIQRGDGGPIKIGSSDSPDQRLRQLQTASAEPLRLIQVWQREDCPEYWESCPMGDEAWMHLELADYRLEGEWFRACRWVQEFLAPLGVRINVPHDDPPQFDAEVCWAPI